ncbi:hypothetical protein BDZ89DRAFT_1127842 [Hymenopellis radicata]|nr:hypothetical protein BDZ89DRAFT_1127842 [Hymenopellis radicata]
MYSRKPPSTGQFRRLSQETAASGIAESTISNAESLRLSQFPAPPSSIPTTPIHSSPSSLRSTHSRMGYPPSTAAHGVSSAGPSTRPLPRPQQDASYSPDPKSPAPSSSSPYPRDFSAHDWHEGASSIDVDAQEDRLLSTSFITSLLREREPSRRTSIGSDAFSGFSEMTYLRAPSILTRHQTFHRYLLLGIRDPYLVHRAIPEVNKYESDYSDTVYSHEKSSQEDVTPTVIRSASYAQHIGTQQASVVGIASATLQNIGADARRSRQSDNRMPPTARSQSRQSNRSTKSVAASFFSRISSSSRSVARAVPLPWRRLKPLPPVPTIPHIPIAAERAHREQEATLPLSNLAERANALDKMLQKGHNPHHSLKSNARLTMTPTGGYSKYQDAWQISSDTSSYQQPIGPDEKPIKQKFSLTRKQRKLLIAFIFLLIVIIAVGVGVGVSQSHKSSESDCATGLAGARCNLNATCVCTSSTSGRCDGLAQNIVDLTPTMNTLFSTNYSLAGVYNSIWIMKGSPAGRDCSSQSNLVDVGAALSSDNSPNRTTWAEAALLWDLVQSQDSDAVQTLKSFVAGAPWSKVEHTDGPVPDDDGSFSVSASGFIFNFANQSVGQDPVSFAVNGQPSQEQIGRVGDVALPSLNRMYAFALASSTQQQGALMTYWTSVLAQREDDLSVFLSLVASAPIILPFDATAIQDLMADSTTDAFPPPLSCFPGLTNDQVQWINDIEISVFALPSITGASHFDTSCYPDRPIYGVVDLLRLRLPFAPVEDGIALQGAVLNRNVGPRAVIHNGELLSLLPGVDVTAEQPHPRDFGTLNHMSHVILAYLSSLDTNLAVALVNHVMSYGTVPPDASSIAVQSLNDIPSLEVAIFGSVLPADIRYMVSSFSTTSGSLFFGSEASSVLRNWTISGQSSQVVWADNSTSTLVAYDSSLSDSSFSEAFNAAAKAVANNVTSITAANVTSSLNSTGKMDS